jgi:hypothetical protein
MKADPKPVVELTESLAADSFRKFAETLIAKGIPADQTAAGMILAAHEIFVMHWGPVAFVELARGAADNIENLYLNPEAGGTP